MQAFELRYNIMALTVAILREDVYTVEEAFQIVKGERLKKRQRGSIEEIVRMRESGMTYREIGEIFGTSFTNIHHRVKKYKEKCENQAS